MLFSRDEKPKPAATVRTAPQTAKSPFDEVTPANTQASLDRIIEQRLRDQEFVNKQAGPFGPHPPPGYDSRTYTYTPPQQPPVDTRETAREEARRRKEEEQKKEALALRAPLIAFEYKPKQAVAAQAGVPAVEPPPREDVHKDKADNHHLRDVSAVPGEPELFTLFEGTIIDTVLVNRLNAAFVGPMVAQVSTDVPSRDGTRILIREGSRFQGKAEKIADMGQERIAVTFHRVIMPNGFSKTLEVVPGLSQGGEVGLRDRVNHHYLRTFGTAAALGLVAGFSLANTQGGYTYDGSDAYRRGFATSMGMSMMQILNKFLNLPWTYEVRPGWRIQIMLTADLKLPEYNKETVVQ